jgi:hypothetical protein
MSVVYIQGLLFLIFMGLMSLRFRMVVLGVAQKRVNKLCHFLK